MVKNSIIEKTFFFFLSLTFSMHPVSAQTFMIADTTQAGILIDASLRVFDVNECLVDSNIAFNFPIFYHDVSFKDDPNYIYGYGPKADLTYPWDTLMNEIRLDPGTTFPGGASTDDPAITALTCDYSGNLYAGGIGLSTYDIEDNTFDYIGDFPSGIQAGGALTYRDGKMYMTSNANQLIEVDLSNPTNSNVLAQFPAEIPLLDGLVTFPYRCDSIVTYAIGRDSFESIIYELDFENYTLTELCQTELRIFGASTAEECIMPPCQLYVDLDMDDSSGELGNNFQADTACVGPISIADADVEVFSLIDLDSITVELVGFLDGGQEFLMASIQSNLSIVGNGTNKVVLINEGNASFLDFANVINSIVYENIAADPTYGQREVILTAYALFYEAEPAHSIIVLDNSILQLEAAINDVNCFEEQNGSVTLQANGGMSPYNFIWQDGTSAGSFDNLRADTYYLTIEDATGCRRADSIAISQPDSLAVTVVTPANTICEGQGNLVAQPTGGTPPFSFAWSTGSNDVEISNLNSGTYEITVTDTNDCVATSGITLVGMDTTTTTQSEILCEGESFAFNGTTFTTDTTFCETFTTVDGCDSTHCLTLQFLDTTLVQEYATLCQGETLEVDGQQLSTDTTLCLTYQAANGCDSTYCITVEVLENNTVRQATICEGETYDFDGQQLMQAGSYTTTYPGSNGCDSVITVDLSVEALPIVNLTPVGAFCTGETVQLQVGDHATYVWSTGETTEEISITSGGTYSITVTDEAGCTNADSILVVEEMLEFQLSTAAPSCFGEQDGQISIDSVWDGQPPYLYSINGGPLQQSPVINGLAAGNYTVMVEDAEGCQQQTTIQLEAPPERTLQLANELEELALGDSIEVKAIFNFTPRAIQWLPAEGLNCDTCSSVIAQPIQSTTYYVTAIDSNDCAVENQVRVIVNRQKGIYIPNAFSPNADGINDNFTLYGNESVSAITRFLIFDRWGSIVFDDDEVPPNAPAQGWDGQIKGQPAATGLYVYRIEVLLIDGTMESFTGEVLLVR